jgi:YggT family protein
MLNRSPLEQLVGLVFGAYYLVLFVRVILSWLPLPSHHPLMRNVGPFVYRLTEPLLAPIRRALRPYMGNAPIDISPVVLYLALMVAERFVLAALGVLLRLPH